MSGMSNNGTIHAVEELIEDGQNIILTDPKSEIIDTIKYYRLGYDYLFLAHEFNYKGETIEALDITILFKVFDVSGAEVLFESTTDEMTDQRLYFKSGDSCYLNELYQCLIDEKGSVQILPSLRFADELKNSGYRVSCEVKGYYKDIAADLREITEAEFNDIMRNNKDLFESAQNTCYFTQVVENPGGQQGIKYDAVVPKRSYKLEIITNDNIQHPDLIQNDIASGDEARELAGQLQHTLNDDQFFLLTSFINGRVENKGKMYLQ